MKKLIASNRGAFVVSALGGIALTWLAILFLGLGGYSLRWHYLLFAIVGTLVSFWMVAVCHDTDISPHEMVFVPTGDRLVATHPMTRILSQAMDNAAAGKDLAARRIAALVTEIAADRLIMHHGANANDPFAGADAICSPLILACARSTLADGHLPSLSRRAVHSLLKELDQL